MCCYYWCLNALSVVKNTMVIVKQIAISVSTWVLSPFGIDAMPCNCVYVYVCVCVCIQNS